MSSSGESGARDGDLVALVRCQHLLCAISIRSIVRLVLPEEVRACGPGVVDVGGVRYAAWDLGERLALPVERAAYCLLHVAHRRGAVPIALATGPCRSIERAPASLALPRELLVREGAAVAGIFVSEGASGDVLHGIELDVERMWTPEELDASADLLESSEP